MKLIICYLLIVNALGMLFMLIDKQKARRGAWRIPEATLLTLAALGGSAGCIAGMYLFRHKTKHLKFTVGLPLLLIFNFAVLAAVKFLLL
jgi:uncharacterized membrane protein YsdA (DUF1294 family)